MPPIDAAYQAHQRKRWMRPNAHLFIRPDWRRFVRPADREGHPFAFYERKYRPDQLRDDLGRWADEGGGGREDESDAENPSESEVAETEEFSAASRKSGSGHHYIPGAEIRNRGVSAEATKVFEDAKTGALYDPRSNKWDKDHRAYNDAVGEALDRYLAETNTSPDQMTADQAREFLKRVLESPEPRIRNFNMIIQMREIMRRVFRGGGRE